MTKKEKLERCKSILNSGQNVITSAEEFNFLVEIFKAHPYWELKCKGQGIKLIEIRQDPTYKTKCFYIVRDNDTCTDISYLSCINPENLKKKDVLKACRRAIEDIKRAFAAKLIFPIICPIEHIELKSLYDVNIDHYDLDFKELVKIWIDKHGGIENLWQYVCPVKDNSSETFFTSQEIIDDFIDFHNKNTHLRAISKHANLSTRKKKHSK